MKILFALRLYSGLENSVINEKWQPNGIPTIYKLLESIDKKHDIKVLLMHKIPNEMQYSKYKENHNKTILFKEFKGSFEVISSIYSNEHRLNKYKRIREEFFHFKVTLMGLSSTIQFHRFVDVNHVNRFPLYINTP